MNINDHAQTRTSDGTPKHRYVQHATPARHGFSRNILLNQ